MKVGQFEVTFKNLYEGEGAGYIFLEGELEVRKDGKLIGIAAPQRRVYAKWGQMQFAEAAVIPSLGNEFYATLMAVDQQNRAVFRLSSNPLVNWLWIGGILMCCCRSSASGAATAGKTDAAEARRNRKTLRRPRRAQEHLV